MTGPDHAAGTDRHPGPALSGLLDGEVTGATAGMLRAHVGDCPACAEELHWVRSARWSLRNLPPVEPPAGFLEAAVDRVRADGAGAERVVPLVDRRRAWGGAASVAAGVALFALTVAAADPGPYRPAVDAAVGRHVASITALSSGPMRAVDGGSDPLRSDQPVAAVAPPRDPSDLPPPFRAPSRLDDGYRLVEAFTHPEGLQLVYRDGRYGLSVFEAPGRLDVAGLPPDGRRIDVAGVPGWRWESDEVDGRVVVFERDGLVVTVIGDEPGEAVTEAARSVPAPRPLSLGQRVDEAGVRLFEALSP
jgi:anti-sigma factor RsiW